MSRIATAIILVLVGILLIGPLLGYPVGLVFVETESMEDTIEVNDGFVALPVELVGTVERGDVIVFQAEKLHGGKVTTHRVVGETDQGYITQGDNNPVTDQAGGEPPVQSEQIIAVAWQPGGSIFVIPHVGTVSVFINEVFETLEQHAMIILRPLGLGDVDFTLLVFATLVTAFILDSLLVRSRDSPIQEPSDSEPLFTTRQLIVIFAIFVMIGASFGMVAPSGSHDIGIVSSSFASDRPDVIQQGTEETSEFTLRNGALIPMHVYLGSSSSWVTVHDEYVYLPPRSEKTIEVTQRAPDETGYFPMFLQDRRYFAILPEAAIVPLYRAHPWVPIAVINAMFATAIIAIGITLTRRGFDEPAEPARPSGDWRVRLLRSLYY